VAQCEWADSSPFQIRLQFPTVSPYCMPLGTFSISAW